MNLMANGIREMYVFRFTRAADGLNGNGMHANTKTGAARTMLVRNDPAWVDNRSAAFLKFNLLTFAAPGAGPVRDGGE